MPRFWGKWRADFSVIDCLLFCGLLRGKVYSLYLYLREVALFDCDTPWNFHQTFANRIKNKGELACYTHKEQFKKKILIS